MKYTASGISEIPCSGFAEVETLHGTGCCLPAISPSIGLMTLETERVHVGDEDKQAGKVLAAGRDAEFGALLDCIVRPLVYWACAVVLTRTVTTNASPHRNLMASSLLTASSERSCGYSE